MSPKRAATADGVSKSAIEEASLSLDDLPEKPRAALPLKEAVESMYDAITATIAKGYSVEEVADLLSQQGVPISSPSLRYYLTRGIKKPKAATSPQSKKRSPSRSKTEAVKATPTSEATSEANSAKTPQVETSSSPAKASRRKPSASASTKAETEDTSATRSTEDTPASTKTTKRVTRPTTAGSSRRKKTS